MAPSKKSLLKVNFVREHGVEPKNKVDPRKLFLKGNNENMMEVIIDGVHHSLNRKMLIESLKDLKDKSDVYIGQLDVVNRENLDNITDLLKTIKGTKYFDIIKNDINDIFNPNGDTKVRVGSVASVFIESGKDAKFTGPTECDPRNVKSLITGTNCSDSTLIYNNDKFDYLNNKKSIHAYIYIISQAFLGFTDDNIKFLRKENIKLVTLIIGDDKNAYKSVTNNLEITELPKKQNIKEVAKMGSTESTSNGNTWLMVLLIIALLVILIIFFIIFARGHYRDTFVQE